MFEIILIIVFILTALLGITEIIHKLMFNFIAPKNYRDCIIVFLHSIDAIDTLNTAIYKLNLEKNKKYYKIIAIDSGLDETEREQVLRIVSSYDNIIFGHIDDVCKILKNFEENGFG